MKKLYTLLFLALSVTAFAQEQLPNNDFENWGSFNKCNNEDTLSQYTATFQAAYYYNTPHVCASGPGISKSTDAYSGLYAIKLSPVILYGQYFPPYIIPANSSSNDKNGARGIPFTSRPSSLTGYYKFHQGQSTDSLNVFIELYKNGNAIGYAMLTNGITTDQYTKFDLSIDYITAESPDSLIVSLNMGDGHTSSISPNTFALLDNLKFEYANTSLNPDIALSNDVIVYQKEGILEFSQPVSQVKISNITGNTVIENVAETQSTHVNSLDHGIYILSYYYNNKPKIQKIIIN